LAGIREILKTSRVETCDMPWEEYKAFPAMNGSTLSRGIRSMLDLRHSWDNPKEDTDSMLWGRAVHCLCLEPGEFLNRYVPWEGARRQGKAYEEFAIEAAVAGKEVLTLNQWYAAQRAALAFVKNPRVKPLIASGKAEQTVLATEMGMQHKGRLDWVSSPVCTPEYDCPNGVIADLKTSADIHHHAFGRVFYKFHYDMKLGLYQRWWEAATGLRLPVFVMCLQGDPRGSKDRPHDVAVIPIPDAVLDRGVRTGLEAIRNLREAIATNFWPGVDGGEEYFLDTPPWEMGDEMVEFEE